MLLYLTETTQFSYIRNFKNLTWFLSTENPIRNYSLLYNRLLVVSIQQGPSRSGDGPRVGYTPSSVPFSREWRIRNLKLKCYELDNHLSNFVAAARETVVQATQQQPTRDFSYFTKQFLAESRNEIEEQQFRCFVKMHFEWKNQLKGNV